MTYEVSCQKVRTETDGLGTVEVPSQAYWGASTQRAKDNFPITGHTIGGMRSFIWGLAAVKISAAQANETLHLLPCTTSHFIQQAAQEVMEGAFDNHFIVDRVQGGAGTSSNMNANEVIANRATELQHFTKPDADHIDPLDEVNRSQSTNDVYPTALKIALLKDLGVLQDELIKLTNSFDVKANEFAEVLKVGRTQLQEAVPMTLGQEFGAFASALHKEHESIDRVSLELREINLGGTAIGTGITSPEAYRELAVTALKNLTGMSLTSAPDLIQATSDPNPFLAISAALRRLAVKLSKICNDLRLLASGPQAGFSEIILPAVQPGSSIMPGKVNPVIPEMVNQVAFRIIGIDTTNTLAAEAGQLQLNAFLPVMADGLLDSITWLSRACKILRTRCVTGIRANKDLLEQQMKSSVSLVTALTPSIGYMAAANLAQEVLRSGGSIVEKALSNGLLTPAQTNALLEIDKLTGRR